MPVSVPLTTIDRLRRLVAEPSAGTYSDTALGGYLQRYPLPDGDGRKPTDTGWTGAWDLFAAAAEVWDEKAAALVGTFDFAADGGDYKRSQAYQQATAMAKSFRAKRKPSSLTLVVEPKPAGAVRLDDWIGNAAEEDD